MGSIASGISMILVGIFGLVPLLFVMAHLLVFRYRLNPFQYLIISKLTADGLAMLVPVMAFSASQLFFGRWLHEDNEHIVGYLALSLQYSSIYTSVAMTVNRFIVVTFPRHYNKWFNTKTTMVSITACWVIAWVHNTIHLKEGCNFTFDAQIRQFKFSDEECGRTLSLYQDLIYNLTMAVITTLVDVYCLLKLSHYRGKTVYSPGRSKKERSWFLQTTTNSILYVLMLVSFHVAGCFEGITIQFILTVVAWQLYLASAP
ncbi:hypothetical protein COOONC_17221 [Cooperia oncophora]